MAGPAEVQGPRPTSSSPWLRRPRTRCPSTAGIPADGDGAVAGGGDGHASGSTIITGDRNVVQQGKYNIQIDRASGLDIGDGATVNLPYEE